MCFFVNCDEWQKVFMMIERLMKMRFCSHLADADFSWIQFLQKYCNLQLKKGGEKRRLKGMRANFTLINDNMIRTLVWNICLTLQMLQIVEHLQEKKINFTFK